MSTDLHHSILRFVKVGLVNLALLGMGLSPLGATTLISSVYDPSSSQGMDTWPHEWSVKLWKGVGQFQIVEENRHKILRLETEKGCISLFRSLEVNVQENPIVSWEWKGLTLPSGASGDQEQLDDYGAAFYLIFSSTDAPERTTALGYVWDNTLPVGTSVTRPDDPNVRYIVVRSGQNQLNMWLTEERNVLADYQRGFGNAPVMLQGMSLVVDSEQTQSKAASFFGPIRFGPEIQVATESQDRKTVESEASKQNKLLGALLMYLGLKHPGGPH